MNKFFILDTNVLIHNPMALYSFSDNTVVIPMTVIEELDHFKTLGDKKGMNSRQALREIDGLIKKGALKTGAKMKNKGTLLISWLDEAVSPPPSLDMSKPDNKILSVGWMWQKRGELVFFISKDLNARIKAEALGIRAADYEKEKVEYASLYKGWLEVAASPEEVQRAYTDGRIEVKGVSPLENQYGLLMNSGATKSSALCKYDPAGKAWTLMRETPDAMGITPINREQRFAFDALLNDKIKLVTLIGQAGSGKTLIAIACGLLKCIGKDPIYEKMLVARPIMPLGRDIGYLPGTKDQKMSFWMQPIFDNLNFIFSRSGGPVGRQGGSVPSDKIDYLIKSGILEIEALTFIRGRSIPKQFMIIDEAQNLTPHEVKTIVSRAGEGTKIVLTGDPEQIDNPYLDANSNGLTYMVERLKGQPLYGHMLLTKSERSPLASLAAELL
jgi:PhoH-like ATPase